MSRFWTACIAVVVCSLWSSIASASFTASPDPASLGTSVLVGSTANTTVTITHNGTTSETLGSLTKPTGAQCDPFTLTVMAPGLPWTTGSNGATRTVSVDFDPVARLAVDCTVTMRDGGGTSIGTFHVTGTGVAPELGVSVTSLDFGGFPVAGGNDTPMTFDIQNNGDAGQNLTVDSVTLGGVASADYSLSAAPSGPIAPGAHFTMTVTFNPTMAGTRDATVTVTATSDPVDSTEVVNLTGVGQIPTITTTPDPLNFTQLAGTQSAVQNITVGNSGDSTLTITSATISAGGMGWIEFSGVPQASCADVTTTCTYAPTQTIGAGGNRAFGIRCQPPAMATGSVAATVTFASDTVGGDNQVTVNCTAQKPDIMLSTNALTFADTNVVGATNTQTLTVTNTGAATLTYNITKVGGNTGDFTYTGTQCTAGTPCTLGAGANRVFTFTFDPSADGARSTTFHFNSDDQETPDVPVTASGNGIGAEIFRVTGDPLDFGQVQVGNTGTGTITFRNDGTGANLVISGVTLSGGGGVFTLAAGTTFPITIPPASTGSVDIVCTPTARQVYSGIATASNNSWNNVSFDTNLTCQGINGDLRINSVVPPPEASFDFGNVAQGSTLNQTFTLKNFGELPVNGITASIAPTGLGYSVSGVPTSLAAGAQQTVTVSFSPTMTADGGNATVTFDGDLDDALLLINGNGLSNGIDVSPGSLAYGDTRWDLSQDRTFLATNNGESTLTVSNVMLASGIDFSVVQVRIDHDGSGGFETTQAGVPPSFVLCGSGDTTGQCPGTNPGVAEFTVRFAPEDTLLGAKSDMLTLIDSLPFPDDTRTVLLTGNSVSPDLGVVPGMTIDFGGVDIDGPAATRDLVLTNTGSAMVPLDVDSHTAVTAPFAASGFAPSSLAMGESNTTTFTYTPTVEQAPPGDVEVVTYNLTGLHSSVGPNAVMITLQGNGTDRHFVSNGPIVFPPTYRNTTPPPTMDVTVMNTGAAPLDVAAVMLSGDPEFSLVNSAPTVVNGGATATFTVQFNPMMAGSFNGIVGVTHDDNGVTSPSQVMVSGTGVVPEMMFPPTVEIGTAIVGEDIHRDDVIQLLNMSNSTSHPKTFVVRALTVADQSGVITVDDPAMAGVAPGDTGRFGATFTPTQAGPFTTTVDIFVDTDPVSLGQVTLTGHAVEVDVKGGGCSAGSGAGGGLTVVLVLGIAATLRRRRRRDGRAVRVAVAGAATVVVAIAVAPAVRADVTVQSFHPMPSIEDDLFEVESATVGTDKAWAAGIALTYARDPLLTTVTSCGGECPPPDPVTGDQVMEGDESALVKQQTVVAIGGAYAIANRFEVGLTIPILMQSGDTAMIAASADGATLGDIAAHGKVQLLKLGRFALGAAAVVTAPTAKDGQYAGYSGPSGQITALASQRGRRYLVSVNVGFLGRKAEQFAGVQQGSAVVYGAGAGFRLTSSLWIAAELFGDKPTVSDSKPSLQALGGLRARLGNTLSIGVGGGAGIGDGLGVPKARGFVLLAYSPKMRPQEPIRPPPPPPDTRDSDGDGIVNAKDKCPNEAEDIDLFEDQDGCPDNDNDGDSVADAADKCPGDAEDVDGFQDDDGCPEVDNDGDGIEDKTDVCPNNPEDKDGHADLDGCPDDDNDHDGIPDATDKCVNEAETINGNNDDDGCPDRGDSLVLLAADRIEILEPIKFSGTSTKMTKQTINVLGQVAATLRANPEIVRIRVTAHVHPRWTKEKDQTLSDDRAKVIKDWLVNWGISTDRVDARGFGSQKPLVSANKPHAEEINDRVEFVIMEKSQ